VLFEIVIYTTDEKHEPDISRSRALL